MARNGSRSIADDKAVQRAVMELRDIAPEFMREPQANVVGVGVGEKHKRNRFGQEEPTGGLALIALVNHKVQDDQLSDEDRVPATIGDLPTDVLEVGEIVAQTGGTLVMPPLTSGAQAATSVPLTSVMPVIRPDGRHLRETYLTELEPVTVAPQLLAARARPAKGGYSVGHFRITAGTIGTCAYDILPGGSTFPPMHGAGIPPRFYILSNNHVLANSNAAAAGDPILQPGPFDGGNLATDRIATLSRFVPITFEPPVPRTAHRNIVDAAIAEAPFHDLDRELHWVGSVRGWRLRANVLPGLQVKKVGRTTNLTVGRITAIAATVDVNYGVGIARFTDQIVTTNISAGGDSGSLVVTLDNVAVGLLFAGSSVATIVNHIENVRALLRVEVAEQIL